MFRAAHSPVPLLVLLLATLAAQAEGARAAMGQDAPQVPPQGALEEPAAGRAQDAAHDIPSHASGTPVADTASQEGAPGRQDRPAIVNGEAITAEDVASYGQLLGEERRELSPAQLRQLARRSVAEEILLAAELVRLGVTLDDRSVDEYWQRRRGTAPDYEALAKQAGTTAERQRTLARRAAAAELYLLHRVGLRTELARAIPPDPLLVRLVTITPSQLREAFASNHRLFDVPDNVSCDVYSCADAAAAQAVTDALARGGGAALPVAPLHRTYPVPQLPSLFPEDVVRFMMESTSGTARTIPTPQGLLVVVVTGRQSGRPAGFVESQDKLKHVLQNELLGEARKSLVVDLAQHATFWPTDLFAAEPAAAPVEPTAVPLPVTKSPAPAG
ncbi:MAG TPA: hypothetical protein VK824_07805, partial [Planctomycetota bacterium]|nr:hypothetical protein [Planctomycetota bacterium]